MPMQQSTTLPSSASILSLSPQQSDISLDDFEEEKVAKVVRTIPDYPCSRKKSEKRKSKKIAGRVLSGELVSVSNDQQKSDNEDEDSKFESSSVYRDYSEVQLEDFYETSFMHLRDAPFSVKLHRILSNPEYEHMIAWLPHGRSWRVIDSVKFANVVIPIYFRHNRFSSFMRQVNGWGFHRVSRGIDINSYYHEFFLQGLPHLCLKMRRLGKGKVSKGTESKEPPNFYKISAKFPLQRSNQNALKSLSAMESNDIGSSSSNSKICNGNLSSGLSVMRSQNTSSPSILDSVPILHQPYRPTEFDSKPGAMNTNDRSTILKPNEVLSVSSLNNVNFTNQLLAAKQAQERNAILSMAQNQDFSAIEATTTSQSQTLEMQQRIIEERLRQKINQRSTTSTSMIPMILSNANAFNMCQPQQQCNVSLDQSLIQPSVQNNVRALNLREALMKSQIENQLLRANLLSSMTSSNNNDDQRLPHLKTTAMSRSFPSQNTPYMNSPSNFFF